MKDEKTTANAKAEDTSHPDPSIEQERPLPAEPEEAGSEERGAETADTGSSEEKDRPLPENEGHQEPDPHHEDQEPTGSEVTEEERDEFEKLKAQRKIAPLNDEERKRFDVLLVRVEGVA